MRIGKRLLPVVLALAMNIGHAPPAAAIPPLCWDAGLSGDTCAFYVTMHDLGVTGDPESVIEMGHTICDELASGVSRRNIVGQIIKAGLSSFNAEMALGASIMTYCPEYY